MTAASRGESPLEATPIELSLDNLSAYLRARGMIDGEQPAGFELLGGGISNTVVKVALADDCFVVKQSLPKLKVAQDWFFDRRRIFVERDCMAALGELLPPGSVPAVRFSDQENFVLGMSCAPASGQVWKQMLLEGRVDLDVADRAGHVLAVLHSESYRRPELLERFQDQSLLIQGRIDPYHRTVARLHPELTAIISAEVDRMLETRLVLVHGDYSPKNIVAYPTGLLLLDFEVAHFGDPAFDVAFCLTHLVLKAAHFRGHHVEYLASARRFWDSYREAVQRELAMPIDRSVVAELGCLLLARIDGKSRVEYITDETTRDFVREVAREILLEAPADPAAAIDWLERRMSQWQP